MSGHDVAGHYDEAWREDIVPPHTAALFTVLGELGLGPGSKVLDLGCGNGVLGRWLVGNLGCEVWGSEISEVAAARARERGYAAVARHSLEADTPPFPGKRFDVAVLCAIVEHLFAPEMAIRQAHASLRDDGILVVLTPNVTWIVNRLLFLFGHWESGLLGGTTGHIRYLNQAMLARLLVENGFRDLDWSHSISLVLPPGNLAGVLGLPFRVPGLLVGRRVRRWQSLWAENLVAVARRELGRPATARPTQLQPWLTGGHWVLDTGEAGSSESRVRGNVPLLVYVISSAGLAVLALLALVLPAPAHHVPLAAFAAFLAAVVARAWMLAVRERRAGLRIQTFLGRALEVAVALPAFVLVAPLLLLLGLGCWLATGSSHVGVVRQGRGNRPFLRLALCTRRQGAPEPGPVGRWLERLRIANLPVLINVLRGRTGFGELLRREG